MAALERIVVFGKLTLVPLIAVFGAIDAFAQADSLSGGAGWVGAGLLGAVLAWLCFFHLPAKDKQLKELIDLYAQERVRDRAETTALRDTFSSEMNEIRQSNAAEQKAQREEHARQMSENNAILLQLSKEMRTAVHDVRDTAQVVMTKTAVADEKARQQGDRR